MSIQVGKSANIQGLKLAANPRTGVPMAKLGDISRSAIPAGSLPKRGRRGGGGNPLARIPKEWLTVFEALTAPGLAFRTLETQETVSPVDANTGEALTAKVQGGELKCFNVRGEEVNDVLFITEETEEHPEGEQYTPEGVEVMEVLAHTPVEAPPETINKMYQAMTTFNKATGKHLRMHFDHNKMDDKGNIITQTKVIWRVS